MRNLGLQMRRVIVVVVVLLVVLCALGPVRRGILFPVLPHRVTRWWVAHAVPLGSSYDVARSVARARGWEESSGTWVCRPGENGALMTVKLGNVALRSMVISLYAFADLVFDERCRLVDIKVDTGAEGP